MWLDHLERAPKTKANIKSLLGLLIEAAVCQKLDLRDEGITSLKLQS